jgi:hypothetical protein
MWHTRFLMLFVSKARAQAVIRLTDKVQKSQMHFPNEARITGCREMSISRSRVALPLERLTKGNWNAIGDMSLISAAYKISARHDY